MERGGARRRSDETSGSTTTTKRRGAEVRRSSPRGVAPARPGTAPSTPPLRNCRTLSSVDLGTQRNGRVVRDAKEGLSWPYVRSAAGEWLYEWDGPVPGARDLMLRDVFGFEVVETAARGVAVVIPVDVWEDEPRLSWCAAYWDARAASAVIEVPLAAWDAHDEVVGMDAPELSARQLLDTEAVADLAGCSPRTVANYLARGLMPLPVARLGGSPVWPKPLIRHWLATRPGRPGRPRTRAGLDSATPAPAARSRPLRAPEEELDDEDDSFWSRSLLEHEL